MKVNFLDLKAQYRTIRKEVLKKVTEVCDSQHFVLGENVRGLEAEIAAYCNASYGVGVASGTDALFLALMASGVGHGDRVLTTPYTFFATAGAISRLGAVPIFVDICPDTYNIDTDKLAEAVKKDRTRKLKAIVPVHLYGQCADMDPVMKIAGERGLSVIEDAAQSIGADYKGHRAGSIGDVGCFSFYPSKNLGGFGDGGMVTTGNAKLAKKISQLRVHGSTVTYHHGYVGINSRLDELQAAVLRIKAPKIEEWSQRRIKNAARYDSLFKKAGIAGVKTPVIEAHNRSVYNQYVINVPKRDALRGSLAEKGVGTAVYYPLSLHLQDCFKDLGYKKGDMPVSEKASRRTLALPIYPELSLAKQRYVVDSIAEFYAK